MGARRRAIAKVCQEVAPVRALPVQMTVRAPAVSGTDVQACATVHTRLAQIPVCGVGLDGGLAAGLGLALADGVGVPLGVADGAGVPLVTGEAGGGVAGPDEWEWRAGARDAVGLPAVAFTA